MAAADIRSYRDLLVWQSAVELAEACYRSTSSFPAEEMFGLTSQMRRASVSIAANIAEGHGRETTASFVQFLRIAQGSTKELETHIAIAQRVGLLEASVSKDLMHQTDEIGKMLRGLIRSLQRSSSGR